MREWVSEWVKKRCFMLIKLNIQTAAAKPNLCEKKNENEKEIK
jgi:hypothetical protein